MSDIVFSVSIWYLMPEIFVMNIGGVPETFVLRNIYCKSKPINHTYSLSSIKKQSNECPLPYKFNICRHVFFATQSNQRTAKCREPSTPIKRTTQSQFDFFALSRANRATNVESHYPFIIFSPFAVALCFCTNS